MTRPIAAAGLLVILACSPKAIEAPVRDATSTAILTLDSPLSKAELDDAAKSLATTATGAARAELLSDKTTQRIQAVIGTVAKQLSRELSADLQRQLHTLLLELQKELPPIVRVVVDEILNGADSLRETLVGAPLRADVAALVDEAAARLQTKAAALESDSAKIVDKWKLVAAGFLLAAILLLGTTIFARHELRAHRAELATLLAKYRQ